MAAATSARGQNPDDCSNFSEDVIVDYTLINLGEPLIVFQRVQASGINERGEVVGTIVDTDDDASDAFFWLPLPHYGLSTETIRTLTTTDPGTFESSGAFEINDAGAIAGWQGDDPLPDDFETDEAVVWRLGTGSVPEILPVTDPLDDTVVSRSINNDVPFLVVGEFKTTLGPPEFEEIIGSFYWRDGDASVTYFLEGLSPAPPAGAGDIINRGVFDVSDTDGSVDPYVVTSGLQDPDNPFANDCDELVGRAQRFQVTPPPPLIRIELRVPEFEINDDPLDGAGFGVNRRGDSVGYGVECVDPNLPGGDPTLRFLRASYWPVDYPDSPHIIGELTPFATDESYANAVTSPYKIPGTSVDHEPFLVVAGRNESLNEGVVWKDRDDDATNVLWCYLRLDDAVINDPDDDWRILEATDVTDDGWVLVRGRLDVGGGNEEERSAILIPTPNGVCLGDTDADSIVEVDDLLNVLHDWRTNCCTSGDVDGSGRVNKLDLTAVVLQWGLCPACTGCTEPPSLEDEFTDAGLDWPSDWEEFVENIDDENYRCWLEHYLGGGCCPICPTCPGCSGPDPFDTGRH